MAQTSSSGERIEPAALAERVHECSARARASGALVPFDTESRTIEDGGVRFAVRVSATVAHKAAAAQAQNRGAAPPDPFAPPWESDLCVGHVSDTHVALLNKFNVLDDHLLLVTREYEDQQAPLTRADFEALLLGLAGIDGLAFYNGGPDAGASQAHKHLQIVPLPLAPGDETLPMEPRLREAVMEGETGVVARLPFAHAVAPVSPAWIEEPARGADAALACYRALWRRLGREPAGPRQPMPYNLLATRQWMWLVPRSRERIEGMAVNALGYAGALLVRDETEFARLAQLTPMRLLAATGVPPSSMPAPGRESARTSNPHNRSDS